MMGTLPLWDCVDPMKTSMATDFFFIAFTIVTAMVIMVREWFERVINI
jgi:hypothetical protein